MTNEVTLRCQKTPEIGIRRITHSPPSTPLDVFNGNSFKQLINLFCSYNDTYRIHLITVTYLYRPNMWRQRSSCVMTVPI